MIMMLSLILVLFATTLFCAFALGAFDLAFGQDLLPKPGTNQPIGTPNSGIKSNPSQNATAPPLPQSPLAPFLK